MEEGMVSVIDVSSADDVRDDLARRDYTIDAMAAPILEDGSVGQIIDPFGGLADLEVGVIRMVDPANLSDDPLRLLRAARIATERELRVEDGTALTIRSLAPALDGVAGERKRDEITRIFASPRAYEGVRLMDSLGLLDVILPELAPARGVDQPPQHHYYDVFEHSVRAVAAADEMLHDIPTRTDREWMGPAFREGMAPFEIDAYMAEAIGGQTRLSLTKFATLLHDVAKPETKSVEADGRVRFLGHPEQGADKARAICNRLRFGSRETAFVCLLVEEHLRPTMLAEAGKLPSRRALYRFFRDLGDAAPACLVLSLADAAAATGPRLQPERWRGHVAYSAYVLAAEAQLNMPKEKAERLISGRDLIEELGMAPGPELGRVLDVVDEAIAIGEISSREAALEMARGLTHE
jgi:tRNA nucleotidyltransferase/poly(A) polymerase